MSRIVFKRSGSIARKTKSALKPYRNDYPTIGRIERVPDPRGNKLYDHFRLILGAGDDERAHGVFNTLAEAKAAAVKALTE